MPVNFTRRLGNDNQRGLGFSRVLNDGNLTDEERRRIEKIKEEWNFYEGYHWEGIDDLGSPQVTFNYCKPFINKFVSFELGKGFVIKANLLPEDMHNLDTDRNGVVGEDEQQSPEAIAEAQLREYKTFLANYLESVWKDNSREELCQEFGQMKSVTGEAWIKVFFESPDEISDIFIRDENPNGRIRIEVFPTQYMFPEFDENDSKKMTSLLVMYPISIEEPTGLLRRRNRLRTVLYKEYWTNEKVEIYRGDTREPEIEDNPYGFIPFVQMKNLAIAGRTYGLSDLDDLIPLNIEMNSKRSDVSEIIDYHSAPITCVFGAKIGNLEKGANKVWGGLPKDAKVENLTLQGDLQASTTYIKDLKTSMCEIGGVPESILGGASAISNTSGVALHYMNMPLVDKTNDKKAYTISGLVKVNKMILYISLQNSLVSKPDNVSMKEFLYNEVSLPDTLPKDDLIELQKIQQEMLLGLECRHGAMERLNKENISDKLAEIDRERQEHPEVFNSALQQLAYQTKLNSGMNNGQTAIEQVRKEVTGQNGGGEV